MAVSIRPTGGELHDLVRQAFQSFQQQLDGRTSGLGVTSSQWRVLRQLWLTDGRCQSDLASLLGISQATLTMILQGLEKKELVDRRRNAANRREMLVFLTVRGRDLQEKLLPAICDVHARASCAIPDKELDQLKTLLRQLIDNLDPLRP